MYLIRERRLWLDLPDRRCDGDTLVGRLDCDEGSIRLSIGPHVAELTVQFRGQRFHRRVFLGELVIDVDPATAVVLLLGQSDERSQVWRRWVRERPASDLPHDWDTPRGS